MFISHNFDQFRCLFIRQLKAMLSADELGAFILVLANSQQDASLKAVLQDELEQTFDTLKDNFDALSTAAAPDDVEVFRQLLHTQSNEIPLWQSRQVGHWQVVYNAMRRLRPARASTQKFTSIRQAFDDSRFHFNKPFLAPEVLWQGEYADTRLKILYNKFPFCEYHLLIALEPELKLPQQLTAQAHQLIYALTQQNANVFPGFGIGFNSLAAGASVNHLHFQGFIRESRFPVEQPEWRHLGGSRAYPLTVRYFSDADRAWSYIAELIADDCAFNCLYRDSGCYVMPRVYQGSVVLPSWLAGAGWLDVAGVITVSDESMFTAIDEVSVNQALATLSVA